MKPPAIVIDDNRAVGGAKVIAGAGMGHEVNPVAILIPKKTLSGRDEGRRLGRLD